MKTRIAIVGSGPGGLMAATQLAQHPHLEVHLFEKRPSLGRKLLIAGSSGLNISHECEPAEFAAHYTGFLIQDWTGLFQEFGTKDWLRFIEKDLGLETFLGTSNRYFVKEMKASGLLKRWTQFLEDRGVQIHSSHQLVNFEQSGTNVDLSFLSNGEKVTHPFAYAAFFLGGGSWEENLPEWPSLFQSKGIAILPFEPSNVGYEVKWKPDFLREAEGKPLKKIIFTTNHGSKAGELVVTHYGLEGTPVYFHGRTGSAFLDLKPDLTAEQIFRRLQEVKENLSPMRRVKQKLNFCDASLALLFHHSPPAVKLNLDMLVTRIKKFPIELLKSRPLLEAISSRGGVSLAELDASLALKKFPRLFCGGEMLNWDAPTGGFLIQASVSQGAKIGRSLAKRVLMK